MKPSLATAACLAAVLLSSTHARADVASFYAIGAGASLIDQGEPIVTPMLDLDLGIGTLASRPLVLAGLFHFAPQFAVGADLGGALRLCTGSYARGEFGLALDLGAHHRFASIGGVAGSSRLVVGGPWGMFAGLTGSYGQNEVWTGTLAVGVDFARATVHRAHGEETLPSPLHQPMVPERTQK